MTDGPVEKLKERDKRPLPHEHKEIARGSGPAAILLFLHIAVIGYLIYIAVFLLTGNKAVFWNLVPFKAALVFYFPAAFAVFTALPTDKLTRVVARVAQIGGLSAAVLYGACLMIQWLTATEPEFKPGWITICAIVAAVMGGLLCRLLFTAGLGEKRLKEQKKATGDMAS